jgi:choline dehydrogenase
MGFLSNTLLLLASTGLIAPILAQETYDYIVVGSGKLPRILQIRCTEFTAGPGGGPLASNLARANYTVLLIEAGDQSVQTAKNTRLSLHGTSLSSTMRTINAIC